MDTHIDTSASLASVAAEFNYIAAGIERARNYTYDPPPGTPRSNATHEPHLMTVRDIRPIADQVSLDGEGLALVRQASAVRNFYDEDELRRVYYPEAERLVAAATGARRVVVFDHTVRRRVWGAEDRVPGAPRQPVGRVHNDYTERSGPQRVRDLMGEEAEALLARRFEIVNVWRPITGPLRDAPLGVCDARSVDAGDWVPSDLIYRDRTGETYAVRYNPTHRWYYVRDMMPDEALLLKCFDSAKDGRARMAPHSAFEDATAPTDKLPRESIELRTLVFHV